MVREHRSIDDDLARIKRICPAIPPDAKAWFDQGCSLSGPLNDQVQRSTGKFKAQDPVPAGEYAKRLCSFLDSTTEGSGVEDRLLLKPAYGTGTGFCLTRNGQRETMRHGER